MKFEIESKAPDGTVVFKGTASQQEASFLLNVGISYLLAQGVMPLLTGDMTEEQVKNLLSEESTNNKDTLQ